MTRTSQAPNALVYDCFSGISGDMHIGAMLDLGVSETMLRGELARLGMADEFELVVSREAKHGITGTKATVRLTGAPGHHRHLADIERIIRGAGYPERVERLALEIFGHIARAEAKIHDKPVNEVHFHEVGATDSIVDIVAAALCLHALDVDQVFCRTLELGGGMVRCAHGVMPVPAPATAEILAGVPCRYDGVDQEATTPTGAAILRQVVGAFRAPAGFRAERVGYGVGQKDFEIPNVLRVLLGTVEAAAAEAAAAEAAAAESAGAETAMADDGLTRETNREIHCNIDDMPAEAFQPLVEKLLAAGARDVYLTPIIMKKARPGTKVSVLCDPAVAPALERLLFLNSTTIGVRAHDVEKHMLPRESRTVRTSLGEVRAKIATLPGGGHRWKVEHDDVVRLAAAAGLDYLTTRTRLDAEVGERLNGATGE